MRCKIYRLVKVELQEQMFTCLVRFEASWIDKELTKAAERLETDVEKLRANEERSNHQGLYLEGDPDGQWFFCPRLYLRNLVSQQGEHIWFQIYNSNGGPIVCLRWELTGTFQELYELGLFPLDVQELKMELCTGWETTSDNGVLLVKNQSERFRSVCFTKNFAGQCEYHLNPRVRFTSKYTDRTESLSDMQYSLLVVSVRIDRRMGYWGWNVIMPMFIVTTLLFTSFAVDPDSFHDRCSITLTLLLAMVAFKFIIAEKLPRISYATLIDTYVLLCFFCAFLIVLLHFFAKVGLLVEPVFDIAVASSSMVNKAAPAKPEPSIDAADSPSSLGSNDCGGDNGGGDDGDSSIAKVSLLLVVLGGMWLALHLLLLGAYGLRVRFVRNLEDSFWKSPDTSVWLGPLNFEPQPANANNAVGGDAAGAKPEADVKQQIREMMIDYGEVVDVLMWTPERARNSLESLQKNEWYRGTNNFAVVVFKQPKGASEAVAALSQDAKDRQARFTSTFQAEGDNLSPWTPLTNACHLNLEYQALTQRQTFQRIGTQPHSRKTMRTMSSSKVESFEESSR